MYGTKGQVKSAHCWLAKPLPTPSSHNRRNKWVEQALHDAETILHEMTMQESFFGPPDSYPFTIKLLNADVVIVLDEGVWQ